LLCFAMLCYVLMCFGVHRVFIYPRMFLIHDMGSRGDVGIPSDSAEVP